MVAGGEAGAVGAFQQREQGIVNLPKCPPVGGIQSFAERGHEPSFLRSQLPAEGTHFGHLGNFSGFVKRGRPADFRERGVKIPVADEPPREVGGRFLRGQPRPEIVVLRNPEALVVAAEFIQNDIPAEHHRCVQKRIEQRGAPPDARARERDIEQSAQPVGPVNDPAAGSDQCQPGFDGDALELAGQPQRM